MEVEFYKRKRGDYPIENAISKINDTKLKKNIVHILETLEEHGHQQLIKTHDAKNLKGYKNLYEIVIRHQHLYFRIFFSIFKNKIWLLHAFLKKTNKTPQKEINIAINNKKEIIN